jgi:methylmalonyl-CoA mutase cobalamin-binding subunit
MDGIFSAREAERSGQLRGGRADDRADGATFLLKRVVEAEVIPRLLQSRRLDGDGVRRPTALHVETLTRLSLSRDPSAAAAQVMALREGGAPEAVLLTELVGPAARQLGALWEADSIDFVDVAAGVGRLAVIARTLSAGGPPAARDAPAALVATMGSERHALGLTVFASVLRSAGWRVTEAPGLSHEALGDLAARGRWRLIGFCAGRADAPAEIAAAVSVARAASAGQGAAVAVGGPACFTDDKFASRVGADFGASEAADALREIQALLSAAP